MLKKKVSSLCGILRKVSAFLPSVCLKNIYFALIHSRLSYLVANWGNSSKSNLRELQVIQNRCLKIVFKKPILYPTNLLYSDNCTSVLPLKALHAFQIIQQMHKISTNIPLHHNYTLSRIQSTRASRQEGNFSLPCPRTEFGRKKITYFGSKLYNELPSSIKSSRSYYTFKSQLRLYFKQNIDCFLL